jgi:hypothetical protein
MGPRRRLVLCVVLGAVGCSREQAPTEPPTPPTPTPTTSDVAADADETVAAPHTLEVIDKIVSTGIPSCDRLVQAISHLGLCKTEGARVAWRVWATAVEQLRGNKQLSRTKKAGACEKAMTDLEQQWSACLPERRAE